MDGPDRNPQHLYPAFLTKYTCVLRDMTAWLDIHRPHWTCKLVEGFRTAAYQHELYEKGRTTPGPIVTYKDGYHNKSNHQTGMAADIGIFDTSGNYLDNVPDDVNAYYGHLVRLYGLVWGGDWHSFKDTAHAEWNTADHVAYDMAAKWLLAQQPPLI